MHEFFLVKSIHLSENHFQSSSNIFIHKFLTQSSLFIIQKWIKSIFQMNNYRGSKPIFWRADTRLLKFSYKINVEYNKTKNWGACYILLTIWTFSRSKMHIICCTDRLWDVNTLPFVIYENNSKCQVLYWYVGYYKKKM